MKTNIQYTFHHFGIPLQDGAQEGVFSAPITPVNSGFSGTALPTIRRCIRC
ncbi:hypothetical protein [Atlantibacter hermannii]|uniref:hypothetical protein n=1 Tax=Atlantibacter hermannii TaxID=565 RepID=UPI00289A47A0|nr:hypothetical protein [Atlantibacter hermannii]